MRQEVRDGRSGNVSVTVSRALGDKVGGCPLDPLGARFPVSCNTLSPGPALLQARTVTQTRDANGRETSQDLLRGMQEDEARRCVRAVAAVV